MTQLPWRERRILRNNFSNVSHGAALLATLNAGLRAEHCPSILESTALVELVGSAMRGFDLGAGADTGLKPEFHGGAQRKGLEQRIRNAFAAAPGGNGPLRAVLFFDDFCMTVQHISFCVALCYPIG